MSDGLGTILAGIGEDLEFTEPEVKASLQNRIFQVFTSTGLLEPYMGRNWYCESCLDIHEYEDFRKQRYRRCPEDLMAERVLVADGEARRFRLSWERFRQILCETNHLSPMSVPENRPVFFIGSASRHIVCWAPASTPEQLIEVAKRLRIDYPKPDLALLVPDKLVLSSDMETQLADLRVSTRKLEETILNGWQLPLSDQAELEAPKLVLDLQKQKIVFQGQACSFPPGKQYLFTTAKIIMEAQGSLVSEADFESQYYALSSQNSSGGIAMSNYVHKTETHIKTQLGTIVQGKRFFINIRGQGYKLNPEFLPAKTLAT